MHYFNTSNVTIQLIRYPLHCRHKHISIHLMLLFNVNESVALSAFISISIHLMLLFNDKTYIEQKYGS